ncbi:hypothetical protein [Amycolatopsis xylanica]|uniref:hypothetical protein n=1 Tax=Amycolatopsis xylanica TaxID=589385 RepID=UPI000B83CD3A|nr:hypothetical protein [Amycolatopsis xylanica]
MERLETATRVHRALDYRKGGGASRERVLAELAREEELLTGARTDEVRKRLRVALADLHNVAGWASFDLGLVSAAQHHFRRALRLAENSGHDGLVANVRYRLGRIALHHDQPTEALVQFAYGEAAAQRASSFRALAILHANKAWAWAKRANQHEASKLLGKAETEFDKAGTDDRAPWSAFFNMIDFDAMTGTVYTELALAGESKAGAARKAIPALSRASVLYSEEMSRSRAFTLMMLAFDHIVSGDREQGVSIGEEALRTATKVKSVRTKARIRPLCAELAKQRGDADAADLARRINIFIKTPIS